MNEDHQLIKQILNGDATSFNKLYLKYEKKLLSFILHRVYFNLEAAQDLLQDTMYKVYKNIHKFDFKYHYTTWVYQIALNTVRNYIKRKKIREINHYDNSILDTIIARENQSYSSPEQQIMNKELLDKLMSEIEALPEKLKTVFILKQVSELKFHEIADILNKSERQAKYIYKQAVEILYIKLKDYIICLLYIMIILRNYLNLI